MTRSYRPTLTVMSLALAMVISLLFARPSDGAPQEVGDLSYRDAIEALAEVLDHHSVIALPEIHGLKEGGEFIAALVSDPGFVAAIDVIVVEFGNSLYQPLVDRYVDGGDVSLRRLSRVWRDTVSPANWDAPIYEGVFRAARNVNMALPRANHVRVLAGDSPVDWDRVRSHADLAQYTDGGLERVRRMATYVNDAVTAGKKTLIVAGVTHLVRLPGRPEPDVIDLIEAEHPGKTYVALTHAGFDPSHDLSQEREDEVTSRLRPGLTELAGTWLGELDACEVTIMFPCQVLLKNVADGYLYLAPSRALSLSVPSLFLYRDDRYFAELKRRWPIANLGDEFDRRADLFQFDARWYPAESGPPPDDEVPFQ